MVNAKEDSGVVPTQTYEALGWIQIPTFDPQTNQVILNLCYRAHDLIGSNDPSKYIGDMDIEPGGDFEVWRDLVINDVVPYPALQMVLIASLSAVPTGVLAFIMPIENAIVHLCAASSAGKTTGASDLVVQDHAYNAGSKGKSCGNTGKEQNQLSPVGGRTQALGSGLLQSASIGNGHKAPPWWK